MTSDDSLTNKFAQQNETSENKQDDSAREVTFLGYLREWADALVIAFVVAMFIRMFVVELFKIPSGSMSPTLLGDFVAKGMATDSYGDSHDYLLISDSMGEVQVFQKKDDGYFDYQGKHGRQSLTSSQQVLLESKLHREEHRIVVNKFSFWFKKPKRGDIVVFRVPFELNPPARSIDDGYPYLVRPEYHRDQSVYVKRAVAFENESLEIGNDKHLYINGEMVTEPEIIEKLQYIPPANERSFGITVPRKHLLVFGDNSDNSLDSRYWGPLPEDNLRGKAIVRYWPLKLIKFLSPE